MVCAHFGNVSETIRCLTLVPYPGFWNSKAVWIRSKNCTFPAPCPGSCCLQYG